MKPILTLLLSLAFSYTLHSQQVTNSSGATLTGTNMIIEYAIGEVAIATLSAVSRDVTQGVLQPNIKVQNPDCGFVNGVIKFSENPSKDKIRIVGIHDWIKTYQIFASDGRLIRSENYYNNQINISDLPAAGIYFIRLLPGCNGSYQIIKFMKQ